MAISGNYTMRGDYMALVPDGCDPTVLAIPDAAQWVKMFPAAYVVVDSVNGSAASAVGLASVYSDNTQALRIRQFSFQFTPDMNGANFIAQAYAYLKTLADFSSMTDVLEDGQTA